MDIPDFLAGSSLLQRAFVFACEAHAKEELGHPVEVARLLQEAGFGPHVVAAGVLHEILEDTETDESEIAERFGPEVAALVEAMTEDDNIEPFAARKAEHRSRIAASGFEASAIAVADKLAKVRQLRRQPRAVPARKLDHYARTLDAAREAYPEMPFLAELDRELDRLATAEGTVR
jgi:(p)ppGpp synthase/HD superfamily hydrolase